MHYGKVIVTGSLKSVPAANPIHILRDKVRQAWYCAKVMAKQDFQADAQDNHSQADTAAVFFTDAVSWIHLQAFPHQTHKVLDSNKA